MTGFCQDEEDGTLTSGSLQPRAVHPHSDGSGNQPLRTSAATERTHRNRAYNTCDAPLQREGLWVFCPISLRHDQPGASLQWRRAGLCSHPSKQDQSPCSVVLFFPDRSCRSQCKNFLMLGSTQIHLLWGVLVLPSQTA